MKRFLLLVLLCLLCAFGAYAFSALPRDSSPMVREKYASWAGVLRIWVCEDLTIGGTSPMRWLNACASLFEKGRQGVYVSVQSVPASAISEFMTTGINPPDMLIWPAGLLRAHEGLWELSGEYPLRRGLDISAYAVPLLTDAHVWVYDAGTYEALPNDMYDVSVACRNEDLPAMIALSTGLRVGETAAQTLPGVDLGLLGGSTPPPVVAGDIRCRASNQLLITDEPRKLFISGEVDAMVAGLGDLARLQEDAWWQACVTGEYTYIEEMALCSIVRRQDAAAQERRALCEDLLSILLGEGQALAAQAGAMPAAQDITAYAGDALLASVEAGLNGLTCVCPPAFGARELPAEVRLYIEGTVTADMAIREFFH